MLCNSVGRGVLPQLVSGHLEHAASCLMLEALEDSIKIASWQGVGVVSCIKRLKCIRHKCKHHRTLEENPHGTFIGAGCNICREPLLRTISSKIRRTK